MHIIGAGAGRQAMQRDMNAMSDGGTTVGGRAGTNDGPSVDAPPERGQWLRGLPLALAYALIIAVGCLLIVVAAEQQPYNENELAQVDAYSRPGWRAAISGTRQPPLQPAIGVAVRRVIGVGQITQRVESVVAGVGTLVVLAALFWRLEVGVAGAVALGIITASPLMIRYSAYARPYAAPVFLMVLCGYLLVRWLGSGRWFHLAGLAIAAAALPLARVPEPTVFLAATALALVVLGRSGCHRWSRVLPAVAVVSLALVAVGYPMYRELSASAGSFAQTNPLAALLNAGPQWRGLVTTLPQVLADAFPWWPLTLGIVVVAVAMPRGRSWLVRSWLGLVLVVPPLAWAVYYHLAIGRPRLGRQALVYQPRFAYFFIPFLAFALVAVARVALDRTTARWVTAGLTALLTAAFIGQLPATARVLSEREAADWAAAAAMVTALPEDAVVLYDNVVPIGRFRQAFHARPRYFSGPQRVWGARSVLRRPRLPHPDAPLYVLLLEPDPGQRRCSDTTAPVAVPPDGWRVRARQHRFWMYEPVSAAGSVDVAQAFVDFGSATPPRCGYAMIGAAAAVLDRRDDDVRARQLLADLVEQAPRRAARHLRRTYHRWLPALAPRRQPDRSDLLRSLPDRALDGRRRTDGRDAG